MSSTAGLHAAQFHRLLIMKSLNSLLTVTLLIGSTVVLPAQAQSAGEDITRAVDSRSAKLNLASISPANTSIVDSTNLIAAGGRTTTVFDPPSNVRNRPNGDIVCTITTRRKINVYRYYDNSYQWISTDACGSGSYGVIHVSQIRF